MKFKLRPYQEDIVYTALNSESRNTLISAATGSGKTICFSFIIKALLEEGKKVLVLAHRSNLIQQAYDKLKLSTGIEASIYCASLGSKRMDDITIASIQSIAHYHHEFNFDVVIIDEVHRVPPMDQKSQYCEVINKLNCKVIGLTATPYRLSEGYIYGEGKLFTQLDYEIGIKQLIDEGYLTKFVHHVTQKLDLKDIKKSAGDYNVGELSEEMVKTVHLDNMKRDIDEYASDRKHIIIFCVTIDHAEKVKEMLGGVIVHSKMKMADRIEALASFDRGEHRYLINVAVLIEGYDCTIIDCVLQARPTKSPALYVQQIGRGLRLHEGKEDCLILDLANNGREHGIVTNVRVSSIAEKKAEAKEGGEPEDKVCDECFQLNPPEALVCENCGHSLIVEVEVVSETSDYEMVELKAEYWKALGGDAEYYKSKAGNKGIKLRVLLEREKKKKVINHYYMMKWDLKPKFRAIVRRFTDFAAENMSIDIFMSGVNDGKLFPIDEVEIYSDNGFEKIRGF